MEIAITLVTLLAIVVAVSAVADRLSMSAPLVLIVVGIVSSYVPFVPDVELTPELVLVGLLPPLLYAAAIRTSLVDFTTNRRPIALLSVGLVLFTTAGVGLLVWWMLDVPLAAGLALGAVVAPPDAVAATAIARRVGLPRRVVTILEGESLVNDATAIVTLRASIAAIAGSVTVWEVGAGFVVSAAGGFLVGLVVAVVVAKIRKYLVHDTVTDVAISLLTPWAAYVLAEEVHVPGIDTHPSGVLAVVVAGLLLGHKAPLIQSAGSRLSERTNWVTISYVLENSVFLLIGLQVRSILDDVGQSPLSTTTIVGTSLAVLVAVIVLRLLWVFPATYLPRVIPAVRAADPAPSPSAVFVIGWAGMRGVVTLAAVFLLPAETPEREVMVLIAFVVTVGTLLLQGLTLPVLVRWLRLPGPDRHEDHLQEAEVYQSVVDAGLRHLDETDVHASEAVRQRVRERAVDRANAIWERLGSESDTPAVQYARLRAAVLAKEREELLRLRGVAGLDQTILARVMNALDVEESILDRMYEDETTADRDTELRPTYARDDTRCEHLAAASVVPAPTTPAGCEECLAIGGTWVHLRLCMECGHVGCCDSSPAKHATAHFHETGHAVIRSFEPGEAWRWCYVDEMSG